MKNVTILLIVLFNFLCNAQATSGAETINKFIYGSHIQSSQHPDYTDRHNYQQILDAGINFPYQTAKIDINVGSLNFRQFTNANQLKQFDYVSTANAMIRQYTNHELNIDHIYYYTNALYKKWECIDPLFPDPSVENQRAGLIKGTRTRIDVDGNFFIQKDPTESSTAMFVKGPNAAQYKRYMYYNYLEMRNEVVSYTANFLLKAKSVDDPNAVACVIEVKVKDLNNSGQITILETRPVLNSELNDFEFKPISVFYNLGLFSPITGTPNNQSHFDEKLKVFYEITWYNRCDLFLDYIEVYDEQIYNYYFRQNYNKMVDTIKLYNQRYQNFYPNLKFFTTLDEPHGIDAFTPIGIIQHIIDSLRNTGIEIADLYSHAYPNYSGLTDGISTFKLFNAIAKPKKLSFWYFPYEVGVTDIDGLYHYVTTILPDAHAIYPGFFVAVQAWGQLDRDGNEFVYRVPTPAELSAQIMATLSFGAKGI